MQLHYRAAAEQTAEVKFFTLGETDGRDEADCRCFGVDHADCRLIGNDGSKCFRLSLARNNDHIKTNGADRSHRFQFFDCETAGSGCCNHTGIFRNRNESSGKSADGRRCHDAALLDCVVEHCQSGGCAVSSALFKPNFLKNIGNGVADCRSRCKRQIYYAERNTEHAGCLGSDKLSHTGDFKSGFFDELGNLIERRISRKFCKCRTNNARARNTDVEDNIRNYLERHIAPEYREEVRAFLDMSTVETRLKGNSSIGCTYRSRSGRWYHSGLLEKDRDKKGSLTSVLIATRDCTAEKERELEQQRQLREAVAQARRADAAKTDFLRRMSHDIRTPINGIRGMVEIARHYVGNEAKQEECREKIMVVSGFLLELVNNVLDMNKLESGKVQLEAKTFCVRDLVEESAAMVEAQTAEKTLTLRRDIRCDRSDRVIGSPLHVRQVLQNLLSNAVRYNRVGGEIFLSARETARTEETVAYEFVVRDTGVGMSEAFQQRAFEPFAQEDASARSSYTGTGLGLAIVKELVEKMDGTIRLESRKGAGTTFTVCLTFTRDRQARRDEDAAAVPVSICGVNVLLAEDNEINMEIAEFMLANEGAAVRKAVNGQQAVEMFSASEPGEIDVILMDVMMPVMSGLEATRRIRGLNRPDARTVPIFAMTANAFADDAERSRSAGMNEHLTKPIDAAVLTRTIARYVRGRETNP